VTTKLRSMPVGRGGGGRDFALLNASRPIHESLREHFAAETVGSAVHPAVHFEEGFPNSGIRKGTHGGHSNLMALVAAAQRCKPMFLADECVGEFLFRGRMNQGIPIGRRISFGSF